MEYGWLNIGSLLLGLIAWILPMINLATGKKAGGNNWAILSVTSAMACATSICMQYFYQNHFVQTKNWSMLLSTFGLAGTASATLLLGALALNAITIAKYFKKAKKDCPEIASSQANAFYTSLSKAFDIVVESISFIVVSYLLLNAMRAFRLTFLWIVFFMTNIGLVQKYWRMLNKTLGSKIFAAVVTAAALLLLASIFWLAGYLPIDPFL